MSEKPVVVVAMSGGVDSSVAAALLVEQGYSVIGMMLRLWSERNSELSNRCCTPDSVAMAKKVAALLSIPFYLLDARQLFYDSVIKSFMEDYAQCLTPNPCLTCNRIVRWDFLLKHALAAGAEYLATGHYARLTREADQGIQLLRGLDPAKDQSYVLHGLNQTQLQHAMFPLGEFTKPDVRRLARQFHLPVAERPDSQDLCFVGGDGDYRQFLFRHAPQAFVPGQIVDPQGKVLGQHRGLAMFTIGQRKGLGVTSAYPLYVLDKEKSRNELVVGPRDLAGSCELVADNVSWVASARPCTPFLAQIKIRYKACEVPCEVDRISADSMHVRLENPLTDITPGQAAVLYNGEICLGGGIITNHLEH